MRMPNLELTADGCGLLDSPISMYDLDTPQRSEARLYSFKHALAYTW